jgi:hypothetical protein
VRDQSEHADGSLWWLSVTFAAFWAGLIAHEGAHYATSWWARVVGLRSETGSVLVPAAGPLMSLAIVAGCAVLIHRSRHVITKRIAFVTATAAASRIFLIAVPTMQGKSNDEHSVMLAAGWSARTIWTVEAALTTLLLMWIVQRSGVRLLSWHAGMMLIGILAGWVSALTFGRAIGLPI